MTIAWDDLSIPTFEVVRVNPLAVYESPRFVTVARVEILREYLEDYLLDNKCVALATQWEERYSTGDPAFESVVGNQKGLNAELRGREIWLHRVDGFSRTINRATHSKQTIASILIRYKTNCFSIQIARTPTRRSPATKASAPVSA
ncbi:MAG: hypothetical protein WAL95_01335 [Candidatus Acidiferrales bacterium]